MGATSTRTQLALQWTADDELRWDDLPPARQGELRALLRRLLEAAAKPVAEAGHDE